MEYLGLGKRYIFFKTLKYSHPEEYSKISGEFNSINSKFENSIKDSRTNRDNKNFFLNYLNFIKDLAQQERANEQNFLAQQISLITKDPEIAKSKEGKELTKFAQKIANGENLDYLDAINIFNSLRKNNEEYRKAIEMSKERMEALKDYWLDDSNFADEEEKTRKELEEDYISKYRLYSNEMSKKIENLFKSYTNNKNISKNLADRFNNEVIKTLKSIAKDKSFFERLKENIDLDTNIIDLIQNLVVSYISEKMHNNNNNNSFLEWIEDDDDFQKKIEKAKKETYNRVFSTKDESFERYVSKHTRGIAKKFLESSEKTQQQILAKYGDYANLKKIMEEFKQDSQKRLTPLNQALKEAYESYKKEKEEEVKKELLGQENDKNYSREYKKLLNKKKGKEIPFGTLNDKIRTTSSGPSSIAELLANPELSSSLQDFFNSYTPGQKMNLKNDIVFTCSFSPINQSFFQDESFDNFIEAKENFMQNFMVEYKKEGKGTTDPFRAAKVYTKLLKDLSIKYNTLLNQIGKDEEKRKELIDFLQNSFLGGISVKEYRYYNNDLGFHGGTLGGDGKVINAIPNILKMYTLGGINTIDQEIIIDALLNCGSTMIGSDYNSLIDNIEKYLIGGAAMLMFDEGFANTVPFLKKMKQMFGEAAPKIVHLYHLNNLYIPASYVLQNIYENIEALIMDINSFEMTSKNIKSSLEIVNNVTESSVEKENRSFNSQINREKYSKYAQDNVKIHFLFMAGILDIFQNLPEAFNVSL